MSVQELVARAEALVAEAKTALEKVEAASEMQISIAVHRLELFVAELAHASGTPAKVAEDEPEGTSDVDPTDGSSDPSTEREPDAEKPKQRSRARKPKSEE